MDEIFQLLDYLGIQSQSTIQTYARLAQRRHLKKGECLYYGGEDSTNLYFLISCAALRSARAERNIPSVFCTNTAMRTSA